MAVRGIFTETDIRYYKKLRKVPTDDLDALDNRSLWVVCCCSQCIFRVGAERDSKENDTSETFLYEGREEGNELVEAKTVLIW